MAKSKQPKASSNSAARARAEVATREDIFSSLDYQDTTLQVHHNGRTLQWQIRARELSADEIARIGDKHTKRQTLGRTVIETQDGPAMLRDVRRAMIDGPNCKPALSPEDIDRLPTSFIIAFSKHYGMDPESQEERERKLGE